MNKPTRAGQSPYTYVTDIDDARALLLAFLNETILALDTETYWDARAARSRVSLVQLAAPTGAVVVLDALAVDLDVVREITESPDVMLAAHNARFDEAMLVGEGLRPIAMVDTLRLARRALWLPSYGLQAVAAQLLGTPLDKSFQKSNWRRRPLTKEQLDYAALDARVTLQVYEELRRMLEGRGQWEEALAAATLREKDDADRQPRRPRPAAPPSPPLTGEEKRIVVGLKKWRLERAHAQRVPAYMICADRTLEHLARRRPQTIDQLGGIYGLGEAKIERYGEELLAALRDLNS